MKLVEEDIKFLNVDDVIYIHDDTIREEGGLAGIRDIGLLESAVAMPQQRFEGVVLHEGLAGKATAYLSHITCNHAFIDGNKRTGALAALVFLNQNGVPLDSLPPQEELEQVTLATADKRISKQQLTEWMRDKLGGL